MALLFGTGDAENIVTRGLDLKAGDNVVIDDLHFTSSWVLYRHLEKDKGVELRIVPEKNGSAPPEDFESAHRRENSPRFRGVGIEPQRLSTQPPRTG